MPIRQADVGPAFASLPASGQNGGFYCAALDESDLTLTGEAESPSFTSTVEFVSSQAYAYRSRADVNASWRRGTNVAGQKCLPQGLRGELQGSPVLGRAHVAIVYEAGVTAPPASEKFRLSTITVRRMVKAMGGSS